MRKYRLRIAVTLGGFLILMGIIMVGAAIIFFNSEEVSSALETQTQYRVLSLWILLAVGVLDLASGIILRRK